MRKLFCFVSTTLDGHYAQHYAERMDVEAIGAHALEYQDLDEGLRWAFSFLSADRRRSYCLYEAPSAEVLRAALRRAGLPDDLFVEVERVDRSTVGVGVDPVGSDAHHGAASSA